MSDTGIVLSSASTEVNHNLRDIIMERKAERKLKAEEKRQMDLQRIRDMKSTSGIDPLQRFPKEVWEMIFDELDPKDRGNAYQVHPLFRDLLEKNKVRDILLPQIMKLPEFHESYDDEHEYENYCSLRRVSKSMRNAVDKWTEDNLTKAIHKHGTVFSDGRFSNAFLLYESEYEREDVKKLLASFEGKGKKRFFVRALTIHFPSTFYDVVNDDDDDDDDQEIEDEQRVRDILQGYKKNITALLEMIGDQILHLCFQFPHKGDDDEIIVSLDEVYILLQRLTSLLPNLKWLDIEGNYPGIGLSVSPSALEKYPFPHLASLERIDLDVDQLASPQFCNFILGANQHVKILNFDQVDDSTFRLLPTHLIDLVRSLPLTSFAAGHTKSSRVDSSKLSLHSIQPMINLNWKLGGIKLELSDPDISLNDVFQLLQNFPTLENVSLDLGSGVEIGHDGNLDYLRLPNLTELKLKLSRPDINYESNAHFFFSLQFLLYCSKLETLEWKLWSFDDGDLRRYLKNHENQSRGKTLDFRAGLRTLYDSNIWNVFPSLRYVLVEGWKRGGGSVTCSHEYKREDIADGMSVGDFSKVHYCCLFDDRLQHCVMLYG